MIRAGISRNLPDNYMLAQLNGDLSIKSLMEVFDIDKLLQKNGFPQIPDVVGNAFKLGAREGQNGMVLSYVNTLAPILRNGE